MKTEEEIRERLATVRNFIKASDSLDDRNYWIREEFILEWVLGNKDRKEEER